MFKLQTDQNVHFKINLIRYRTLNSYFLDDVTFIEKFWKPIQ